MRLFLVILAAFGILVSTLALAAHYSADDSDDSQQALSRSIWNSTLVNHSRYSVVDGIPVALVGMAGYGLMAFLVFYRHRALAAIFSLFGLGYALYLTNIEAHVLDVWCVYCVVSLILITLIVFLTFGDLISQDELMAD
jgi:vitamin-K-epoxide reductase (warfarin-sensitive)